MVAEAIAIIRKSLRHVDRVEGITRPVTEYTLLESPFGESQVFNNINNQVD